MPLEQIKALGYPLNKYASLPTGWDDTWLKAKQDCATTPKGLLFLGDSFASGGGSTDPMAKSFSVLFKAKLVSAGLPINGDFWHVGLSASWDATLTPTAPPWVFNTAPSWTGGFGYGLAPLFTGVNVGQITFTTPYACTAFDIVGLEAVAGTYTYKIDGGANQTVTTTVLNWHRKIAVTGQTNATHTIVFNASQSATNVMIILGITTYADTSKGIAYGRLIYTGAALGHFGYKDAGYNPTDRLKMFQGNTTAAGTNVGFGFPMQPALCIMSLALNDCQGFLGRDQFTGYLRRLMQGLRRGYADCSVLFLVNSFPDGVSSDCVPTNTTFPQNYLFYVDAIKSVADGFNCAFVDTYAAWADQGFALGYESAVAIHPLDAGHVYVANQLAAALGL